MKKSDSIIAAIVTFLGVVGSCVFLLLLPDTVPVHYNFSGQVDRMGSKWELIIFPIIALAALFICSQAAKRAKTQTYGESYKKIITWTGIALEIFFFGMGFFFMGLCLGEAPEMNGEIIVKGTGVLVGAVLALLGNFMPKAPRNSAFGLRVSWTMEDDAVWQRSQRFSGIAAVIAGVAMIPASLLLPLPWSPVAEIGIPTVWVILSLVVSYCYSKEAKGEN